MLNNNVTKNISKLVFVTLLLLSASITTSYAAKFSPVGTWKTIDDETGKDKSIVQLSVVTKKGKKQLTGRVRKILRLDLDYGPGVTTENVKCKNCSGKRYNKPIKGMTVIWGVSAKPDSDGEYMGGEILDPKTGRIYDVKLSLSEDGQQLKVRGYLGFSLLGRTQTWQRVN